MSKRSATPSMIPAIDARRVEFTGQAGPQSYYVAGEGKPMLLLHSINASGSAYEMRPVFEYYRQTRQVFAPDLPGFGYSDRADRDYSARMYTNAVHDLLDQMPADTPVDAMALSLSSEFLARAATERPQRFRSVSLITPTGFNKGGEQLRAPEGATREVKWLYGLVSVPLWRRKLYELLVKPSVIRYFLKRTSGSDYFDEGLAAYDDITANQPGAEFAPLAFLSARLFSKDIRDVYERLEMPVWLPHATQGDFKDFSRADWARARSNWTVQALEGGALPHFETPDAFFAAADRFLASL
ncbi:MAG: alpha/beta hydrolase [Pseudomonadota bacterium]